MSLSKSTGQTSTPSLALTRLEQMHALLDAWADEIARHPVGCLELHYAEAQVKAALKVSLGHKKS